MVARIMLDGHDKSITRKLASLRHAEVSKVAKYNNGLPLLNKPVWQLAFGGIIFSYVYKPDAVDKRDIIEIILLSKGPNLIPNKVLNRMNQTAQVLTFVGHPDEDQVKTIFDKQLAKAEEALREEKAARSKTFSPYTSFSTDDHTLTTV